MDLAPFGNKLFIYIYGRKKSGDLNPNYLPCVNEPNIIGELTYKTLQNMDFDIEWWVLSIPPQTIISTTHTATNSRLSAMKQ